MKRTMSTVSWVKSLEGSSGELYGKQAQSSKLPSQLMDGPLGGSLMTREGTRCSLCIGHIIPTLFSIMAQGHLPTFRSPENGRDGGILSHGSFWAGEGHANWRREESGVFEASALTLGPGSVTFES